MSIKVMSQVWEHSRQKGSTLLTLLAISDFANDSGDAWPAMKTLARKTRLSERSTQRIVQELVAANELTVTPQGGPRGVNLFHVATEGERIGANTKRSAAAAAARQRDASLPVAPVEGDNLTPPVFVTSSGDSLDSPSVTDDAKGESSATPGTTNEPSTEPLEPSMLSQTPEWFLTLAADERWTGAHPARYIRTIEDAYGDKINLNLEAHAAYEWLQTPAGNKKKVLRGFWTNWLKKAVADPPSQRQNRPGRSNDLPSADDLRSA